MSPSECKALNDLKKNDFVTILPADYNSLDKSDQDSKVRLILANRSTFKKLMKDKAWTLGRKMKDILLSNK